MGSQGGQHIWRQLAATEPRRGTGEPVWGRVGRGGDRVKRGCSRWWSGLLSCGGQGGGDGKDGEARSRWF